VIAWIRGVLAEKEPTRAVIEAAGVGYELAIPLSTYDRLPPAGEETRLLAVHFVREDDEALFGFATPAERDLFRQLVAVSGVGPKSAIAVLSGSSVGELSLAIAAGNAKRLSSIRGIGRKTAEKICLELKDKVSALGALADAQGEGGGTAQTPVLHDALLALTALGYGDETANKMVASVLAAHPDVTDLETVIRLALKG
jgi:Holliday junction DNA helicase RuvA